jgi:methionyl aminopeptidase
MAITIKTLAELEVMRESGRINAEALMRMRDAVRPGVTGLELDRIAADVIAKHGATAAFLGHPKGGKNPFPATVTISVNEQLVHGIPSKKRLGEGDLVSLDCGTIHKGFVSDSAFSMVVGHASSEVEKLLDVTEKALYIGIESCRSGCRVGDVGHAVQTYVEQFGMNVPREYGGHGVGRNMWEEPHIPNWGSPGKGAQFKSGMTIAIEPMVMLGKPGVKVLNDHWTVVTLDGKLCAHFEHTVAITENGTEILTKMN